MPIVLRVPLSLQLFAVASQLIVRRFSPSLWFVGHCLHAFLPRVSEEVGRQRAIPNNLTVPGKGVGSVRLQAQHFSIHHRVEHRLTHRPFDSAEALNLGDREPQSWHFEILTEKAFEHVVERYHDRGTFEACFSSRSASSQSFESCPCSLPRCS
jgi:hypothetical protein